MKKPIRALLRSKGIVLQFMFLFYSVLCAQNVDDRTFSVMLEADIQLNPAMITLKWQRDTNHQGYTVYRKLKDSPIWTDSLAALPKGATQWIDSSIVPYVAYDYRIYKKLPPDIGEKQSYGSGYMNTGIQLPPVHQRGACLLMVDDSFKLSLKFEIDRWMQDVISDGWIPELRYCNRRESVSQVKARIQDWSLKSSSTNKAVFLLGRVPVPYAGDIAPDGHNSDHKGAWPCDGYYGELEGSWTDSITNTKIPPGNRNDNVPGDGKFDNRFFPKPVQLQIGRVDFANMDKFPEGEEFLLRRYLNKDHSWRMGEIAARERALVDNNFTNGFEGLGQAGWKGFTAMFGFQNVKDLPYRTTLSKESYMWSYGAGGGGPESASDISSTTNFVTDSLQTIFTMLFGSYFGDWDYPNNFLRGAIASKTILASTWGARPHWLMQHMAMGESIGYSTLLTMNHQDVIYSGGFTRFIHTGLMGDPTLRMHMMKPVQKLTADQRNECVLLHWEDPDQRAAYFIYRKSVSDATFQLLNLSPITLTSFKDSCFPSGITSYMVRAVALKTSASGSYYNLAPGVVIEINNGINPKAPQADFTELVYFDRLSLNNRSGNARSLEWDFGDGSKSYDPNPVKLYTQEGNYRICLKASNDCAVSQLCKSIQINSSIPQLDVQLTHNSCFGDSIGEITIKTLGGSPTVVFEWIGLTDTGRVIKNLKAGLYAGELLTETGRRAAIGPYEIKQGLEILFAFKTFPSRGNEPNGSVKLDLISGCSPFRYQWSNGSTTDCLANLKAGNYCVTVTDCQRCIKTACVEVLDESASATEQSLLNNFQFYPNPVEEFLYWSKENQNGDELVWILSDMDGKVWCQNRISGHDSSGKIDLHFLHQGIYMLRVKSLTSTETGLFKLIKW